MTENGTGPISRHRHGEGDRVIIGPDPYSTQELWRPLREKQVIGLVVTMIAAAVILLPKVVWAPCFGDPGEVQLTAAVGGIGHPPGQAGIITIMRAFCLISPFAPHNTVSGVNAFFCLGVVAILTLLQLRTGANPVAAGLCSLLFLADDRFWHAATTPETYGTCFILLAGSIWSYLSWVRDGRAWKFRLAAFLFLYLVVNRAPTMTFSVSFVAVALVNSRVRRELAVRPLRWVLCLGAAGLVALVVMLGSLWLRDVPGCGYNYLDQSFPSQSGFPPGNETASDKFERLWWLVTARQYDYMFHPTWQTIRAQWRWLLSEFGARYWPVALLAMAVVGLGAQELWRRNRTVALFVLFMIPAGAGPILLIRVISNTTLLPNLLFPFAWLLGLGLTRVMRWHGSAMWNSVVVGCVCFVVWFTADASFLQDKSEFDARGFIEEVHLESLPPNATLIAFDILPLVYVQQIDGVRPDIDVLLHYERLTQPYLESIDGPVFTTMTLPLDLRAECIGEGRVKEIRLFDDEATDEPAKR